MLMIRLFGEFRVTDNGAVITALHQARLQALLAYLLLHRHAAHSRQQLAFLFWPDSSEIQARANLRRLLHQLYQVLPNAQHFLLSDGKTLQWDQAAPYTLDVAEFEDHLAQADEAEKRGDQAGVCAALVAAVDCYDGDLLPACYDDWILAERERWRERFTAALEKLLLLYEAQRTYAAAITYAQRLLRHDPLHESTYRHLMRLYALNDERASALHIYHTCVSVLQRDLGVEPHPATQAAYARLLNAPAAPVVQAGPTPRPAPEMALVGRQSEWALLQRAWRRANHVGAHCVLIAGEAGIGKTRLTEEMIHWASQQGITTARTRAYAAEGELAYAPVIEWLRSEALQVALARLDAVWLTEVARLLPELLAQQPALPRPEPLTERWQRQRLFEALARAFLLAKQPLLLVIDDLQWCDQETVEWLHYLLRFEPKARLLVVGTARPEEVDEQHPLTPLLFHLRSAEQLTEFELGPLDADETAILTAQVATQTFTVGAANRLYQATEGNPLFIVEMVLVQSQRSEPGDWPETSASLSPVSNRQSLPPKVQATIQARLKQLSLPARELASLAAVMGRWFIVPLLAQASGLADEALVAGIDELWQRRLIREQGANAYDFSHDYIREMAYTTIRPARRRLLHGRVARALETIYGNSLAPVAGQLAVHYEQAGLAEQAIAYYRRAAAAANQLGAYSEMVMHLNKALALLAALPTTPERIEQQVDTLLLLGDALIWVKGFTAPEVEAVYRQARELCLHIEQDEKRFRALRGLRVYWGQRGHWQLAVELTAELQSLAEAMQNPNYYQNALNSAGAVLFHQGCFQEAHDYLVRALALSTSQQPTADPSADNRISGIGSLCRLATTLWFLGYPMQAQVRQDEALALAHRLGRPIARIVATDFAFALAWYLRRQEAARVRAAEIIALADKHRFSHYETTAMIYRGWLLAERGESEAGIALLRQGLALRQQTGIVMFSPEFLTYLIEAYARANQVEQGLAVVADTLALAEATGERYWNAELHRLKGELLLAQGAAAGEVEGCFLQAVEIARQQHTKSLELRATMSLARLWQKQGKRAVAHQLLAEIYGWFTEGFDTADLQAAKALLDELSS